MQVVIRRLIVVSSIAIFGAAAGFALGNFVAGPETAATRDPLGLETSLVTPDGPVADSPEFTARSGPSSYSCQGCDAGLHNDMVGGGTDLADVAPLPPYRVEDGVMPVEAPPLRRDAAIVPRVTIRADNGASMEPSPTLRPEAPGLLPRMPVAASPPSGLTQAISAPRLEVPKPLTPETSPGE